MDYINQLLTGTDQGATDPLDIATTWKFRSSKLRLQEIASATPSPNEVFAIAGANLVGSVSDVTVNLPLLGADDTVALDQTTQTWTNKTFPGGSAATEGSNNYIPDVITYPSYRKVGGWIGGLFSNQIGMGQGGTKTQPTGSTYTHSVSTSGKFMTCATQSGTANSQSGWGSDSTGALNRNCYPTFACKFKLNSVGSNVRFGVYWNTTNAYPTAGSDDILGSIQGLGLFKRSTDSSTYVFGHRGSNGTNFYDTTTISIDTNVHLFRMRGDEANGGWQYSWDNGAYTSVLTGNDYPTTNTVYPAIYIETTDTNSVNFDLFWLITDQLEMQ